MLFISKEQEFAKELTEIINVYAGSDRLRKELCKRKVNYCKIHNNTTVTYILRSDNLAGGKLKVKI